MDFEQYWKEFGEFHASMCGGNIKQFAKEIWGSATSHNKDYAKCSYDLLALNNEGSDWTYNGIINVLKKHFA